MRSRGAACLTLGVRRMNLSDAPRDDIGDWLFRLPFMGRLDFGHRTRKDVLASGGLDQFSFEVLRVFDDRVFPHRPNGHADYCFGSWCVHTRKICEQGVGANRRPRLSWIRSHLAAVAPLDR